MRTALNNDARFVVPPSGGIRSYVRLRTFGGWDAAAPTEGRLPHRLFAALVPRSFAWVGVVALIALLFTSIPAHAAKAPVPDKPEKPDRPEKSDKPLKFENQKPSKVPKSQRMLQAQPQRSEPPATAASPPAPAGSFDVFRIILERNIFNPNRIGRSPAEEPPPRMETIALVGTMQSDEGQWFAFFDSPDVSYQQALHEGETIGGLTIRKIMPNAVQLARDEKPFGLRVNQQLRRAEGAEWRVVARDYVRVDTAPPVEAAAGPAIPTDASAVLRRLMEQRQKQLRQ
jgi:hypothetical protein